MCGEEGEPRTSKTLQAERSHGDCNNHSIGPVVFGVSKWLPGRRRAGSHWAGRQA